MQTGTFKAKTAADAAAIHKLRTGLHRETGIPYEEIVPELVASAGHYAAKCVGGRCCRDDEEEAASLKFMRQSIPLDVELPDWRPHPDHATQGYYCVCGAELQHAYVIYIRTTPAQNYIVGCCCIKRFMGTNCRSCNECGDIHRNRNDNYCKSCRKTRKTRQRIQDAADRAAVLQRDWLAELEQARQAEIAVAEEAAREAVLKADQRQRRIQSNRCADCGIAYIRPGSKYVSCYPCNFPYKCTDCGAGMRTDCYRTCYKCSSAAAGKCEKCGSLCKTGTTSCRACK